MEPHPWGEPPQAPPSGPEFLPPPEPALLPYSPPEPPPGAAPGPPPVPPSSVQAGPVGKVVERPHPLTGIAKSWIALVGLVLVVGRDVASNGWETFKEFSPFAWMIAIFVVIFVGINLVRGIIEWRTTTFVADADEFRIDRNFLSKQSSRISYAKIQSVDIQRALAARILGLASVHIDVGGSGGARLEYLSRGRAEALRDQLLGRMRNLTGGDAQQFPPVPSAAPSVSPSPPPTGDVSALSAHPGPAPEPWPVQPPPSDLVVQMKSSTLVLGLLVSGFLPWLLGAALFVAASVFWMGGFSIAAFGGIVFGVFGYLWSQVANHWNFTLTRTPQGLHVTRGLLTNISRSLKPDRIQAVSIHQDYLQRLTGLYRVRVTVLGFTHGEESGERADTVLPYGSWRDVQNVLAAIWPGIRLDDIGLQGQPSRARWLTPLGFRRHQWGMDGNLFVARHGWLGHTISIVPHRRMQSIGITQGPLQRLLALATVSLHTTDGPVRVAAYHLDPQVARSLFDEQLDRARIARESPGPLH